MKNLAQKMMIRNRKVKMTWNNQMTNKICLSSPELIRKMETTIKVRLATKSLLKRTKRSLRLQNLKKRVQSKTKRMKK